MATKQWVLERVPDAYVNEITLKGSHRMLSLFIFGVVTKKPRYKKGKFRIVRIRSATISKVIGVGKNEVRAWQNCKYRMVSKINLKNLNNR